MHACPTSEPRVAAPVSVPSGGVLLEGELVIPSLARGVVVIADGSGRGRTSPRSTSVAQWLRDEANAATLLVDLVPPEESSRGDLPEDLRFDVPRLGERLLAVREWLGDDARTRALRVAYFGVGVGAAAALVAAGTRPNVAAVISGGGRPDLTARELLVRVEAPTLLVVPGRDEHVIELNLQAQRHLRTESALEMIPGATHLQEPSALLEVAKRASTWLRRFL